MAPASPEFEFFLRSFWLLGGAAALANFLLLRSYVVARLVGQGYSHDRASLAWSAAQGSVVVLAVSQFALQSLSGSPANPLIAFFPGYSVFATVAFALFITWCATGLAFLWFHAGGLVLASAACLGMVRPQYARLLQTAGIAAGVPALLVLMRVAG